MKDIVKIFVTGDLCFLSKTERLIIDDKYEKVFNDINNDFLNNDLNIVDLECPITDHKEGIHKSGPLLKTDSNTIKVLSYLHVNLVAMSNNHIMDYGVKGLKDTIAFCAETGIDIVGVGNTLLEARKPFFKEIKGKIISVLNFTENEFSCTYGDYPGANPLNLIDNYRDIVKAKSNADFVLVLFHGGNEFYNLPSPRVKKTCRFFVEAGADAVVMHHSHTLSGYEIYDNTPIFYGLGNFNFEWEGRVNVPWNYGYTVRFVLSENKTKFEILPHQQSNGTQGTFKLHGDEKNNILENIAELNRVIQDDAELNIRFKSFCREKESLYAMYFQPYSGKILPPLYRRGLLPNLYSKQKTRLILNLIRCESHRDIFLHLLQK